jgi:hypothetical protein
MVELEKPFKADSNCILQLIKWAGLDLAVDRVPALLPGLQRILDVDAGVARLGLATLTTVGFPWQPEELDDDKD